MVSTRFSWSRSCVGCDAVLEEEITKCLGRGSSKGVASRSFSCWEAKTVSHPKSLISISHSLVWDQNVLLNTMYDGYNNDTFLMFVPTICIISSHKLSCARIRHEADMSSHENIIEYIHTLSDASLSKSPEHVSSFIYNHLLASLTVKLKFLLL